MTPNPGGHKALNPYGLPAADEPLPNEGRINFAPEDVTPDIDLYRRHRDPTIGEAVSHRLAPLRSVEYCRKGAILVHTTSPDAIVVVPARCKTWSCPRCGPILANLWSQRIAHARPERFITLTCQKDRFPQPYLAYDAMKAALPQLVRILRAKIGRFEYCAIWETHESGWPHLHLVQRGVYIPAKFLKQTWENLGIGYNCDIRSVTTTKGAARYASKYMTKTIADGKRALGITKVIQYSRHFFPKDLLASKPLDVTTTTTAHTHLHPAEVLQRLMQDFGYILDPDSQGFAFRLTPGTSQASTMPADRILEALSR
jgi:hypothetical protein